MEAADNSYNHGLKAFYQRHAGNDGVGRVRIESRSTDIFGKKDEQRLQETMSRFEELAGVTKIRYQAPGAELFQYISKTCTLRTAFANLTETNTNSRRLKILVAVSSSARDRHRSCVAIIVCRGNDPFAQRSDLGLSGGLQGTYKKWNLPMQLTPLTTHSCR